MKFRKKPIEIEAMQWTGDNWTDIDKFILSYHETYPSQDLIKIPTLEGVMEANKYDWIIKGVNGEFYPCKPDIFEKTYDKVDSRNLNNFHDRIDKTESTKEYKDYSLCTFTEKEYDANEKFRNKHYKKCNNGNRFVYELIGTGLGEVVKITCPICGKCKDITDIEKF